MVKLGKLDWCKRRLTRIRDIIFLRIFLRLARVSGIGWARIGRVFYTVAVRVLVNVDIWATVGVRGIGAGITLSGVVEAIIIRVSSRRRLRSRVRWVRIEVKLEPIGPTVVIGVEKRIEEGIVEPLIAVGGRVKIQAWDR